MRHTTSSGVHLTCSMVHKACYTNYITWSVDRRSCFMAIESDLRAIEYFLSRAPSPCHRILQWHGAVTHRKNDFAVNVSDDHDVQSHMFRPTITDMQDTYCGNCYDIYLIQSQYTKVAAYHNTCLACRWWSVWTCMIGHHVPRHKGFTFPRRSCACAKARSTLQN